MGGLGGCTILVSYTKNTLYFSHHWEIPGFKKDDDEGYHKVMFDEEVLGFLTGEPNNNGDGKPLVAPGIAPAAQVMHGASTYIITPGARIGFSSANFYGKVDTIAKLTTSNLEGHLYHFPLHAP